MLDGAGDDQLLAGALGHLDGGMETLVRAEPAEGQEIILLLVLAPEGPAVDVDRVVDSAHVLQVGAAAALIIADADIMRRIAECLVKAAGIGCKGPMQGMHHGCVQELGEGDGGITAVVVDDIEFTGTPQALATCCRSYRVSPMRSGICSSKVATSLALVVESPLAKRVTSCPRSTSSFGEVMHHPLDSAISGGRYLIQGGASIAIFTVPHKVGFLGSPPRVRRESAREFYPGRLYSNPDRGGGRRFR